MAQRQRQKCKPLQSINIQFDAWARTGTKRCNAKTGQMQMAVNAEILEFYIKLQQQFQHHGFVLLFKSIAIM